MIKKQATEKRRHYKVKNWKGVKERKNSEEEEEEDAEEADEFKIRHGPGDRRVCRRLKLLEFCNQNSPRRRELGRTVDHSRMNISLAAC